MGTREEADRFLASYNAMLQPLYARMSEASWKASTDVTDLHVGERIGAEKAAATFIGNPYVIETCQRFLQKKDELDPLVVRQLDTILRSAADYPGTLPYVVSQRVEAEAKQSALLDSFEFCLKREGEKCVKPITPNEIDDALREQKDLTKRLAVWKASKEIGAALKPGLTHLRDLRNQVARKMGNSSYFGYQVSDYDMTVSEMMSMLDRSVADLNPLYQQVHCWAKNELAKRYGKPVPRRIPAHWLTNRWGQEWSGIVEGVDLDPAFKGKSAEWIVKTAEAFYVSLGFPKLPKSFWDHSDLYALPAGATRKKNTHASAWHLDLDRDVRSLMSVEPNWQWFGTAHHELGHVYYFMAYSTPKVPLVLREGANRAFHEAIGDLIFIASSQPPYLKKLGILPKGGLDRGKWLLNQALEDAPVFLPFSAGVMSVFEHDLYEKNLPESDYNRRWWELVGKYQGIDPPEPRPAESCDACTKTHISDDPAQYYDYAMAHLLKYQLHNHICRAILKQDPHDCDYSGNKKVGDFLRDILERGNTGDWRKVVQEATGEEIGSRAVLEYFKPVQAFLEKENRGRDCSF